MLDVSNLVLKKKAFTATTEIVSISSNSETPILLLKNPSSNDQNILVTKSVIGVDANSVRTTWRAYGDPTITSDGTGLVEANTFVGTSTPSAKAQAFKLPTVSANGQILNMYISPANQPSRGINRFYFIEPGSSLLITIENSSGNTNSFADVYWLEY